MEIVLGVAQWKLRLSGRGASIVIEFYLVVSTELMLSGGVAAQRSADILIVVCGAEETWIVDNLEDAPTDALFDGTPTRHCKYTLPRWWNQDLCTAATL